MCDNIYTVLLISSIRLLLLLKFALLFPVNAVSTMLRVSFFTLQYSENPTVQVAIPPSGGGNGDTNNIFIYIPLNFSIQCSYV